MTDAPIEFSDLQRCVALDSALCEIAAGFNAPAMATRDLVARVGRLLQHARRQPYCITGRHYQLLQYLDGLFAHAVNRREFGAEVEQFLAGLRPVDKQELDDLLLPELVKQLDAVHCGPR
jgi:hypothetical protein